jgi:ubiquinone/menaquinone biosynthesis C-methylase UbiE
VTPFTEKLERGALDDLSFDFAPQVVLFAVLKLGIFSAIVKGATSVNDVALATKCSPRGVKVVLNCLVAMGLLEKENEIYGLNDFSRKYFLPSSENYVGEVFSYCDQLLRLWLTFPEAVRTGRPSLSIFTGEESERLNINIVEALFQVHKVSAWTLVDVLKNDASILAGQNTVMRVLDVAAGSAVWSIPFTLKFKQLQVAAIDFAPVLEVAKRYTRQFGVENRYRFIDADIREIEFEPDAFDAALLGHICHSEGAKGSQRLIAKCFRALKKNGSVLIMDYIPDEEKKSELLPLLVAVNALLGTEEGDTFTFSEYRQWLLSAGFSEVRCVKVKHHAPIIIGLKGDR